MSEQIPIPTSEQFVEELDRESRWYELGFFLGVPTSELDIVKQNYYLEGTQRCLIELFKYFQSRSEPVSWNDIADALRNMHNNYLADQICRKYVWMGPSPPSPHSGSVSEPSIQLKDTSNVSETTNDPIFVDIQITNEFSEITKAFANLIMDIRNALQKKSILLSDMQFFLQELCELEPLSTEVATLDLVLLRMSKHYCFINYKNLAYLVDRFLRNEKPLQQHLQEYLKKLEKFKKSAKLKDLMKLIKEKRELYGSHKVVEIKLHGIWFKSTLQRFERLAKVVFEGIYQHLVQIRVTKGCVCASWVIPKSIHVKPKLHNFMRTVGCDANTQTFAGEVAITAAIKMKDNNGFTLLHSCL